MMSEALGKFRVVASEFNVPQIDKIIKDIEGLLGTLEQRKTDCGSFSRLVMMLRGGKRISQIGGMDDKLL